MRIETQQHGLAAHSAKAGGGRRKSVVMRLIDTAVMGDGREMKYILGIAAVAALMLWAGLGS